MVMRVHKASRPSLMCQNPHCDNVSSPVEEVETKLLQSLELWLEKYKVDIKETPVIDLTEKKESALAEYISEKEKLQNQQSKLHDLLEQGVYTIDTFLERSKTLSERQRVIDNKITLLQAEIVSEKQRKRHDIIPKLDNLLKIYAFTSDVKMKNDLLKDVLQKAIYKKDKNNDMCEFDLTIYPKIY